MTGASTSIFDLLQDEEEQQPSGVRRPGGVRGWPQVGLAAALLAGAVVLGLRMVGIGVSFTAVFAGFLAVLLLRRLARMLAPPPPVVIRVPHDPRQGEEDGSYDFTVRDALGSSVNRWETKLTWSQGDAQRFERAVRPALAELVDELLRQRHGITRTNDPDRARALLGATLWQFLDTPAKRTPSPRDLAAIVAPLEKL